MVDEHDRATFPDLAAEIGEDPARFLDATIIGTQRAELVTARIKGIDDLATIQAWKRVERELGRGAAGGPREGIMRMLERRESWLEEHGERWERQADSETADSTPTEVSADD